METHLLKKPDEHAIFIPVHLFLNDGDGTVERPLSHPMRRTLF